MITKKRYATYGMRHNLCAINYSSYVMRAEKFVRFGPYLRNFIRPLSSLILFEKPVIIHKKTSKEIGDGGCYDNTKYVKYKTLDILSPDVHHSVVDVNITAKCLMFRPLNCNNNQASLKLQLHGCKVLLTNTTSKTILNSSPIIVYRKSNWNHSKFPKMSHQAVRS